MCAHTNASKYLDIAELYCVSVALAASSVALNGLSRDAPHNRAAQTGRQQSERPCGASKQDLHKRAGDENCVFARWCCVRPPPLPARLEYRTWRSPRPREAARPPGAGRTRRRSAPPRRRRSASRRQPSAGMRGWDLHTRTQTDKTQGGVAGTKHEHAKKSTMGLVLGRLQSTDKAGRGVEEVDRGRAVCDERGLHKDHS